MRGRLVVIVVKKYLFTLSVLFMLLASILIQWEGISIVIASPDIRQGDLVLQGNNVTVIEGRFDINGSIIVEENATLILRDAIVNFTQTSQHQHGVFFQNPANGKPRLQSENATISSDYAFFISFYGNSSADAYELDSTLGVLEARDSSNVLILNSTIRELNCLDNSVVSISNSTIYVAQTSGYSTVNVLKCEISYFESYDSLSAVISDSSIHTWLEIQSSSVNCSLIDLTNGLISSWNYLLNCSIVLGSGGHASNLTLKNTYVSGWYFIFLGSSNVTIYNSKIIYLGGNDFSTLEIMSSNIDGVYAYQFSNFNILNSTVGFVHGYGSCRVNVMDLTLTHLQSRQASRMWLVNSTSDVYDIEDQSEVYVSKYLDVHVLDSIDQDVPYANVTATYPNATQADLKLTDADGWTRLTLLEKIMNASGEYPVGNYVVEAIYDIYSSSTSLNMTENKQITLRLEDFIIPEFQSLTILLSLMITTLTATILYRRKKFDETYIK